MICDLATYRRLTKDSTSIDGDVTAALTAGQATFEQMTHRHFEQATYTETLRVYPNARVYPSAFPIASVSAPGNCIIDGASVVLGLGYQFGNVNPFVSGFGSDSVAWTPQAPVTYVGGYTADAMPQAVIRAVAVLAYNALNPNALAGVPIGAKSIRLGDLAISGDNLAGLDPISAYVSRQADAYRRISVEGIS